MQHGPAQTVYLYHWFKYVAPLWFRLTVKGTFAAFALFLVSAIIAGNEQFIDPNEYWISITLIAIFLGVAVLLLWLAWRSKKRWPKIVALALLVPEAVWFVFDMAAIANGTLKSTTLLGVILGAALRWFLITGYLQQLGFIDENSRWVMNNWRDARRKAIAAASETE